MASLQINRRIVNAFAAMRNSICERGIEGDAQLNLDELNVRFLTLLDDWDLLDAEERKEKENHDAFYRAHFDYLFLANAFLSCIINKDVNNETLVTQQNSVKANIAASPNVDNQSVTKSKSYEPLQNSNQMDVNVLEMRWSQENAATSIKTNQDQENEEFACHAIKDCKSKNCKFWYKLHKSFMNIQSEERMYRQSDNRNRTRTVIITRTAYNCNSQILNII